MVLMVLMVLMVQMVINHLLNSTSEVLDIPIIYPLNPNYTIYKINKKTILNSNTKPILIDAEIVSNYDNKQCRNIKFIIKKDKNLRKEQIISCLIEVLQYKLCVYKIISCSLLKSHVL